jgi:hypothetical protein
MAGPRVDQLGITVPTQEPAEEAIAMTDVGKEDVKSNTNEITGKTDGDSLGSVIITGADVAAHLLPMRDDLDPTLTFRAFVLGSGLAAFLAVMTQIYTVSGCAIMLL